MPKTPNRVIRIPDRTWNAYGQVCEAEGVTRTADLMAYMEKRINQFIRRGGELRSPQGNSAHHDDTAPPQ